MPDTIRPLTEGEIRKIAREEALEVQKELLKEIADMKGSMQRIERLLLGELGTNEEDTLKSRANFAYQYAKRNTDAKIIERSEPALEWFESMNTPEKGCDESQLDTLGKMIMAWNSIKWLGITFGVINLSTLFGLAILIINFIKLVKELGI